MTISKRQSRILAYRRLVSNFRYMIWLKIFFFKLYLKKLMIWTISDLYDFCMNCYYLCLLILITKLLDIFFSSKTANSRSSGSLKKNHWISGRIVRRSPVLTRTIHKVLQSHELTQKIMMCFGLQTLLRLTFVLCTCGCVQWNTTHTVFI